MKSKLLFLFILVFLGELVAVHWLIGWLEYITKPLIMIVLGGYYLSATKEANAVYSKPVLGAIVFSLCGDVALMFQGTDEIYFMLGLGSFLIAHLCYILSYNQHKSTLRGTTLLGVQKFRYALPIVLAGTGLITVLYSHLGDLKIPVTIYALVLIIMALKALFRFGHTNLQSFWFVFVGALLFMVSDSLIAITKFLSGFDMAALTIMSTYMLAQFFIIRGLLLHEK